MRSLDRSGCSRLGVARVRRFDHREGRRRQVRPRWAAGSEACKRRRATVADRSGCGPRRGDRTNGRFLSRLGAEWCPWCRKLEAELAKNEIQKVLEGWTLVALDVDKDRRDAAALGAVSIPALRLLTPAGKVAASRDGFVTANELVAWLEENRQKPANAAGRAGGIRSPGAIAVVRLVRQLDQSDALLREAAINRLRAIPSEAAATVVEAFASGSLQTRLAALELLQTWKAPAAGLDPWRPATVTEARLKALREWAAKPIATDATLGRWALVADSSRHARTARRRRPGDRSAARRRSVRCGADPRAAGSTRPGVAAGRPRAIESSRDRLLTRATDRAAVSPRRLRRTRAQMARRSGTDCRPPISPPATVPSMSCSTLAAAGDEGLFLELFNDSDPLVRETALKGLDAVGEAGDRKPLLALLADPEPNVRAAVLKQLAEHPAPGLAAELANMSLARPTPTWSCTPCGSCGGQSGTNALKTLVELLEHENWSVRAEAVEAIGKKLSEFRHEPHRRRRGQG